MEKVVNIKKNIGITIMLFFFLYNTVLIAQNKITVLAGLNMSNYSYNDDDWTDGVDFDLMPGLNFMVEKSFSSITLGAGLNQRGVKSEFEIDGVKFETEEVLNYITFHSTYPVQLQPNLSIFGGLQLGSAINGEIHLKASDGYTSADETEDIDADDIELEYGLLFGGNFLINEKIGIRGAYFKGLSNVTDDVEDQNFKNNSLSISLIFSLNL
jgi:hypothetical protein